MPTIPDFTALGPSATPTPSYRRPFSDESTADVGNAIAGIGRTMEQGVAQQRDQNVAMARAQASNALLDHELAVKNINQGITDQVASGDLTWDKAPQTYQDQVSKLEPPNIENLDPIGQQTLDRGIQRQQAEGQFQAQAISRGGQKQAFSDQFGQAIDKLGKLAGMPGADINDINSKIDSYRPLALAAHIPPEVVDKSIQNFKDQNWLNQAVQRGMESKDSMPQLQQLQHDLVDPDGAYANKLDTDKRNMVLRGVVNDQLILQNRMEHESDKREAKAQSALGQIDEQISSGIPATPLMWEKWQGLTQGTSAEDDFKQRLNDENTVQEVLRKPVAEQQQYVQAKAQDLEQNGGSMRDRANLMRMQTAVNQNINLMQKAPLLFDANRNGTVVQPLDIPAMATPAGQQQFGAQIADRMATLTALRGKYGPTISPSPLLPQEAGQMASQLDNLNYKERAQALVTLRNSTGDDTAYQNMMRQIAPHSPVTAIAGQMVSANAPASTPSWFSNQYAPQLADVQHVLRGEELLNPKGSGSQAEQEAGKAAGTMKGGMPMPPELDGQKSIGLRPIFARTAGDMFRDRPDLADSYYSAFRDAYASLSAEKGDMSGLTDRPRALQAAQIALGNVTQFNGSTVAVPRGMDPSQFSGLVKSTVASTMQQLGAQNWQNNLRGYGLKEVGDVGSGRYQLTIGNTPKLGPDGKILTIDLRNQYLPHNVGQIVRPAATAAPVSPDDQPAIEPGAH